MTRRPKISEQDEARVLEALSTGVHLKIALSAAGVTESTYFEHCKREPGFAERAAQVRARAAVVSMALLRKAAQTEWRAAEATLRLMYPEHYAAKALELRTGDAPLTFSLDFGTLGTPSPATKPPTRRKRTQQLPTGPGGPA